MFSLGNYNKTFYSFMVLVLFIFIGTLLALNLIIPDRSFSEAENRSLEQRPHISWDDFLTGKFMTAYESYLADQIAFRDFWIGVKSDSERFMGKRENNDVYLGQDGYLLQKFNKPDNKSLQSRVAAINSLVISKPELRKYFMLVPTASKILEDKLPPGAPIDNQLLYMNKVKQALDENIKYIDVYDALYSKKDEGIFYKTDHHWTSKGAYYAYKKLSEDMGFTPHDESYFQIKKVSDRFYGSLYSKSGFRHLQPDSIELYLPRVAEKYQVKYYDYNEYSDSLYCLDNLNKKDKYTVFFNGNQSLIKISTNTNNNRSLLVVRDSYANSLIPFLTAHYHDIFVVDLRYYSDDWQQLIKANNINDLLILYNINTFFEDNSVNDIAL